MALAAIDLTQGAKVYQERFDAAIVRTRDIANRRSTGPSTRQELLEVVDELMRLRRDLSALGTDQPMAALISARPRSPQGGGGGVRSGLQRIRGGLARPPDGQRWCANHSEGEGAFLPIDQFVVKNAGTGQRASWCDDCRKAYQRERYISVKAKTMTVQLIEGDLCVGRDCPGCGFPFEIGEKVRGENLVHESCA